MHNTLFARTTILILFSALVGACRQEPLSDQEQVLKVVRKIDSGAKSSYETTKNSFKITFSDFVAPEYHEYIDAATVIVSNDMAYVLCTIEHESKNVLPGKPDFPYKSRRSDFFVLEKRNGRWNLVSTTYYSERGVPVSFFKNHPFYGEGTIGYMSCSFTNDIYYYISLENEITSGMD